MSAQAAGADDELDFPSPLMYSESPPARLQVDVLPRNYVLELVNATEALNRPACKLKYECNHLPGFGSFNDDHDHGNIKEEDHAAVTTRRCWEWDESGLTSESPIISTSSSTHAYAVIGPTLLDIESALAATPSLMKSPHEEISTSKAVLGMSSLKRTATEQQRYTLRVRSQEHTVEDGYRWRKYGQKLIKASSHPRSYYRCTDARCHVKKRVERSSVEAGVVEVTYEGIHLHHRPFSLAPLGLSQQQQQGN